MRFLLLGYSAFAQRRLLPLLEEYRKDSTLSSVAIATRSRGTEANSLGFAECYDCYAEALRHSRSDICYVSLPNNLHYRWARKALDNGMHVVVDKPAVLNPEQAQNLVEIATSRELGLFEATIWHFHRQIERALEIFHVYEQPIIGARAKFTIPSMAESNFRNNPAMGGGSLYDQGPYAASLGRLLFGRDPERIDVGNVVLDERIEKGPMLGRIRGFSLKMFYPGTREVTGDFYFDREYCNELIIAGEYSQVSLQRVFSPPSNQKLEMSYEIRGKKNNENITADDIMRRFMESVMQSIEKTCFSGYYRALIQDSKVIEMIAQKTKEYVSES